MKKPLKKSAYVLGAAAAFILISVFINYAIQLKYSRNRLSSLERELLFKSEQLDQESGQKDQMAQEIIRLESQLLSYKEEAEFLSRNIQDMKIALEQEPAGFKGSIEALEDRITSLDAERNGLEQKNQELQKQLAALSKSSDRLGRFRTGNKELNLKLRQINSEYKKIDSENKILNKELKKLKDSQDRTDYLNSQNRVLTDEFSQVYSERDSLKREAVILRDTVAELKNKFYQFEKDIASQEQLLIQSKARTGLRAEEVLQLQENVSSLIKEKSGIQDVLKEKEGELFKKTGYIKNLDQEILALQGELTKQSQMVKSLHSENEQLKTELKNFQTSYKNLSAVLEDVSNTNTQLQNKISALSRVFEDKGVADLKNEKSVVDLGSMKVIDSEPEIALSSLIYQLRKSMDNATEQEKQEYLKKEAVLHYNLGVYYLRNDRFKDALDEFFKSYQITPDDPDTLYNIGLIYRYYIYDYDKAKDYLQRYLKLRPKSEDRKKAEAIIKEMSK